MLSKKWLVAAIITLFVILSWVIFDIIHARTQVEISPKLQEVMNPISPNFNTQVLSSP